MIETNYNNKPRATKKEITKLSCLNELVDIFFKRQKAVETLDEKKFYFKGKYRASRFIYKLEEEFNNMPSEQHKALWTKFVGDQY